MLVELLSNNWHTGGIKIHTKQMGENGLFLKYSMVQVNPAVMFLNCGRSLT